MRIEIRRRVLSPLPVTMADLAFLLIMFLTLTLDPRLAVDVDLPEFRYAVKTADQRSLTLTIDRDGGVSLEGRRVVLERLGEELRAAPAGGVVTVYADAQTMYETVDAVLSVLRGEQRYRVVLATERPP